MKQAGGVGGAISMAYQQGRHDERVAQESEGVVVDAYDVTGTGRIELEIGGSRYEIIEPHGIVPGTYRLTRIQNNG